jgi:subtilisin family serine protease
MVLLSWPPNTGGVPPFGDYHYDSSAGEGTYVYSLDFGADPDHPEFSDISSFTPLFPQPFAVSDFMENDPKRHGTGCLSKAAGNTVGIARKARLTATVFNFKTHVNEHWLDGLAKIHQDIYVKGRGTKAVVNFSVCLPAGHLSNAYQDKMGKSPRILPPKAYI